MMISYLEPETHICDKRDEVKVMTEMGIGGCIAAGVPTHSTFSIR